MLPLLPRHETTFSLNPRLTVLSRDHYYHWHAWGGSPNNCALTESRARKSEIIALVLFFQFVFFAANCRAQAQAEKSPYPAMASPEQYLMPDKDSEIALARSGVPKSISDAAEVMVLGQQGYTTAAEGTNGFLRLVGRSWGAATDEREFWNPKVRSPICFNPAAARTFVPIYLMKTKLVLAGKSRPRLCKRSHRRWIRRNFSRWSQDRCATCYRSAST